MPRTLGKDVLFAMTQLGILLLIAGVGVIGLGIAGRVKAARLMGLAKGGLFKRRNIVYEARRLYENPQQGVYVLHLLRSSNRLLVTGASLCLVGIVLIL